MGPTDERICQMITAADNTIKFERTDIIPNLTEMLKDCQIIQIYCGKDHNCRCGCGGKYYEMKNEHDHLMIKRSMTRGNTFLHKDPEYCEMYIGSDESYINIPTSLFGCGKTITIYFKGTPKF